MELPTVIFFIFLTTETIAVPKDCLQYYQPQNYLQQLPSLSLPYLNNIPNIPIIKPTPVKTTKVFSIVTKYVYKDPVCVKITGTKSPCRKNPHQNTKELDHIISKEYTVKDRRNPEEERKDFDIYVQGSEEPRPFVKSTGTPHLTPEEIRDLLIEDRLDQLETVLPYYTRRRFYKTSTITVTKVKTDNRYTATLLVKNCVPFGYDVCPPKLRQRRAKLTQFNVSDDFYG